MTAENSVKTVNKAQGSADVTAALFFIAYFLFILKGLIDTSLFNKFLPDGATKGIYIVILVLLGVKLFAKESFSVKNLIICAAFLLGAGVGLITGYESIIIGLALIFSARGMNFDSIVKCAVLQTLIWMIIVILSCKLGIIEDYTYLRDEADPSSVVHSLGFYYYSTMGYSAMGITIGYCYLRKKNLKWPELVILAALNYAFYKVHTTRLSFYLTMAFLLGYVVIFYFPKVRLKSRFWKFLGTVMPWACLFVSVFVVHLYKTGRLTSFPGPLSTMFARVIFSAEAIDKYGIHLFGTEFKMYGSTAYYYDNAESAFYVDSGYIFLLVAYGILFTVLLLSLYSLLYRYIYYKGDRFLYLWLGIMLAASIVNDFTLSAGYNPAIFLIPEAIVGTCAAKKEKSALRGCADFD